MLHSIGFAQFEKEIAEKVTSVRQREDFAAESLGVPQSVDEEDIKKYVEKVVT